MASSDQEGIEIGEEHIEMYEECDVVNGSEQEQQEPLQELDSYEVGIATEEMQEGGEEETKEAGRESSRKRSRSPDVKPQKDDFDDNELDSDVDESEEKDETVEDPEKEEKFLLSMPPVHSVIRDVGHLKQERRVMVSPLAMEEFSHPAMALTVSKDTCEEVKIHFVRPKDSPLDWRGMVTMHFMSSRAAKEAADELRTIREDLDIITEVEGSNPRVTTENWARDQKGQKRWTDTLLYVSNVGENVTEDQLKEIFTDAEDIVIPKNYKSKDDKKTKIAYIVYRTAEVAHGAALAYAGQSIELAESILKICRYHAPVDGMPRGMLKLHERRVVLKYLEKLQEKIESSTEEEKAPEWCEKRLKLCNDLISRDNEARQNHGLSFPILSELRAMRAIKILRGVDRRDLLIRLGVLDRPKRTFARGNRRDRSPDRNKSGYRRTSSKPQSLLGLPPPSLLSMPQVPVIPISMLMQQNSMALMSGLMNQAGMMMGSGDGRNSYRGGGISSAGGGGGHSDNPSKMLRLDASGNFSSLDRKHSSSSRDDRSSGRDGKSSRDDRSSGRDDRYRSSKSSYSSRDKR